MAGVEKDGVLAPKKEGVVVAGVEAKDGVLDPNKEGVGVDPNKGVDDPNGEAWVEKLDPNKVELGADADGVEKRKDDEVEAEGAEDVAVKNEKLLIDEAAEGTADGRGALDAPGVAELANKPAT